MKLLTPEQLAEIRERHDDDIRNATNRFDEMGVPLDERPDLPLILTHRQALLDHITALEAEKAELEIVCICGSSRFVGEMAIHAWEYAKQGILALSCYLLPDWYDMPPDHGAEYEGVADILDALHLQKIDMADRVFIVNVDGYIGDRTRFEIEYATKAGKPIEYLEPLDEPLKQDQKS